MASYQMLGFAKGFAERRVAMSDKEQEKQDKLAEQLQALHLKGLEERQKAYDKKAPLMDRVVQSYNSGDYKSAYADLMSTHANPAMIETLKKTYGEDFIAKIADKEENRKYIEEEIKQWASTERPTISPEELNRVQLRRGVDNLGFERGIRSMLGIETTDGFIGTPNRGLMSGRRNPYGQGVKYESKPDGGGKPQFKTVTNADGSQTLLRLDIQGKGQDITPVYESKPAFAPTSLTPDQREIIKSKMHNEVRMLTVDNSISDESKDIIKELISDETSPLLAPVYSRAMQLQADKRVDSDTAFQQAWGEIKEAVDAGAMLRTNKGAYVPDFMESPIWQDRVQVISPDGTKKKTIPWWDVGKAVNAGGKVVPYGK